MANMGVRFPTLMFFEFIRIDLNLHLKLSVILIDQVLSANCKCKGMRNFEHKNRSTFNVPV